MADFNIYHIIITIIVAVFAIWFLFILDYFSGHDFDKNPAEFNIMEYSSMYFIGYNPSDKDASHLRINTIPFIPMSLVMACVGLLAYVTFTSSVDIFPFKTGHDIVTKY